MINEWFSWYRNLTFSSFDAFLVSKVPEPGRDIRRITNGQYQTWSQMKIKWKQAPETQKKLKTFAEAKLDSWWNLNQGMQHF